MLKQGILGLERRRGERLLGHRRQFNAEVLLGPSFLLLEGGDTATHHVHKTAGTVWAILDERGAVADNVRTDFLEHLRGVRMRHAQYCRMGKARSGQSLNQFLSNYIVLHEFPTVESVWGAEMVQQPLVTAGVPQASSSGACVLISATKRLGGGGKKKSTKTRPANMRGANKSNDYNIFDSSTALRQFMMDLLPTDEVSRALVIDPCCGLGNLTPASENVPDAWRIVARDLVTPEKRQTLYPNFKCCEDVCDVRKKRWASMVQPGLEGMIQERDFFDAPDYTPPSPDEGVIFSMNPPFSIGKSSGIDKFIRRCEELAREWGREATIYCVANRGYLDVWKNIWKLPPNIELRRAHTFHKKDDRSKFMRVNIDDSRYDPIYTDICVLELHVHHPGSFNRTEKFENHTFSKYMHLSSQVRTSQIQEAMVKEHGYCLGKIPLRDLKIGARGASYVGADPILVRSFGSIPDLGTVFEPSPPDSVDIDKKGKVKLAWKRLEKGSGHGSKPCAQKKK